MSDQEVSKREESRDDISDALPVPSEAEDQDISSSTIDAIQYGNDVDQNESKDAAFTSMIICKDAKNATQQGIDVVFTSGQAEKTNDYQSGENSDVGEVAKKEADNPRFSLQDVESGPSIVEDKSGGRSDDAKFQRKDRLDVESEVKKDCRSDGDTHQSGKDPGMILEPKIKGKGKKELEENVKQMETISLATPDQPKIYKKILPNRKSRIGKQPILLMPSSHMFEVHADVHTPAPDIPFKDQTYGNVQKGRGWVHTYVEEKKDSR